MKESHLLLATLVAIAPSALMATPPLAYGDFDLTKAEISKVIDAANAKCPKKSDDAGSIMAKEPLYQTKCRAKQAARSEERLKAAYGRTMPRLSKDMPNAGVT
jgi:hypothetical protein